LLQQRADSHVRGDIVSMKKQDPQHRCTVRRRSFALGLG
jgi:NOL1/NOP2/fmu family ribosome biogenesis protein